MSLHFTLKALLSTLKLKSKSFCKTRGMEKSVFLSSPRSLTTTRLSLILLAISRHGLSNTMRDVQTNASLDMLDAMEITQENVLRNVTAVPNIN